MSVLIKGGRVITAADDYVADIYIEDERISLIGESLDVAADTVIDASGKYVLPGAVDPHTHLDMPFGGTVTIDDVESGQRAAARGGTTCHVDFCIQAPGTSFADALADWKSKADGKQLIDMGYHIAVTDLKEGGSLEELASLPDQGITSYKLFMAYKGALMVDDETLFRTMEVAAETGGARDGARRERRRDRRAREAGARRRGKTEPRYHALTRPPETEGEATNRAIQLARGRRLRPLRRPRLLQGGGRADRARPREGLGGLGRDVHAVLLHRLHAPRAAELRGREVRLHAAAARQGEPGRALERRAHGRAQRDLDRPLRLHLERAEGARQGRLLEDPERRPRPREPAAHDPPLRRPRGPDRAEPDGRAALRRTRRSSSASTRGRGRSPSAPTPTSSSSTRRSDT